MEKTCQPEDSGEGTNETGSALEHKGDLNYICNVSFLLKKKKSGVVSEYGKC